MKQANRGDTFSSEEALISYLKRNVPRFGATLGIGDDAALVSVGTIRIVLTTDSLVENVHFKRDWATPLYLGKKAARVNLSDVAAMGATPTHALISLVLPKDWFSKSIISKLYKGFSWVFAPHRVEIVGGNVSSGEKITITLAMLGTVVGKPLLRSGARVGDIIFCTGSLGRASHEVSLLLANKKKTMMILPPDRIEFAKKLASFGLATACIDISDGLALDLGRLTSESKVGAIINEESLPRAPGFTELAYVLHGGEDYELLFTARKEKRKTIDALAQKNQMPVTAIGVIQKEKGIELVCVDGKTRRLSIQGWDHIAREP